MARDRLATQIDKNFGMFEVAHEMEKKGVDDIIHLEVGRPSFDTPAHIKDASKKALDNGVVHYGDLRGNTKLREALAKKLKDYNGIEVTPTEVLMTNGLTQASFATFMAGLDEGDEVIVFEPYYPSAQQEDRALGGQSGHRPAHEVERVPAGPGRTHQGDHTQDAHDRLRQPPPTRWEESLLKMKSRLWRRLRPKHDLLVLTGRGL